ncbi:MFS transporter [Aneurinibacillus uraniidurans]|uniref:MFS transporter n=1 Tax=Aneurinibacillus uraniidurans TaxID=2966586 RepID=UPI0023497D0A|nr:MFS transporter [Aneurinibacillus sp. B1]WCN37482.1 MFS transporter [Aneurinibacillus sp. B1]
MPSSVSASVQKTIPQPKNQARMLWFLVSFAYLLIVSQRTAPGIISDQLLAEFHISASTLGLMSTFQFVMYAGLQIPIGLWAARLGPARLLLVGILASGIGTILYSIADSLPLLFATRALIGFGDAFIWVNCVLILGKAFEPLSFSTMIGMTGAMGSLGNMLTTMPLAWWVTASGWRLPFTCMGIILLVHALIMYRGFNRRDMLFPTDAANLHPAVTLREFATLIRKRTAWGPFLCHFGIIGTYVGFTSVWAVPYLLDMYGISRAEAASILGLALISAVAGGPLSGWMAARAGNCRAPYIWLQVLNVTVWSMFLLTKAHPPLALVYVLFIALGFGIGTSTLTFASIRENFPVAQVGALTGLANTGGFFSAVLLPPIMGLVFDRIGLHSQQAYAVAFIIPALFASIGIVGALMLSKQKAI